MKIRACLMAGLLGIAVVAGILEALSSPRGKETEEGKKEEAAAKGPVPLKTP